MIIIDLPCINCITLAICKCLAIEVLNKEKDENENIEEEDIQFLEYYVTKSVRRKCSMIEQFILNPTYYNITTRINILYTYLVEEEI